MRQASILIASFLLLFTVSLAVGQETQKATETTAQTEQPKNEVELKLDEYKKQGETVMGTCLVDCERAQPKAASNQAARWSYRSRFIRRLREWRTLKELSKSA